MPLSLGDLESRKTERNNKKKERVRETRPERKIQMEPACRKPASEGGPSLLPPRPLDEMFPLARPLPPRLPEMSLFQDELPPFRPTWVISVRGTASPQTHPSLAPGVLRFQGSLSPRWGPPELELQAAAKATAWGGGGSGISLDPLREQGQSAAGSSQPGSPSFRAGKARRCRRECVFLPRRRDKERRERGESTPTAEDRRRNTGKRD